MRQATTDLSIGIGLVRWSDSPSDVLENYPELRSANRAEGTNPATGNVEVFEGGLAIDSFDSCGDRIRVDALVDFDADGVESISLDAVPAQQVTDPDRWPAAVADAAVALGEMFGFGPVDRELMDQEWTLRGAKVTLFLEHSEFQVTVTPAR